MNELTTLFQYVPLDFGQLMALMPLCFLAFLSVLILIAVTFKSNHTQGIGAGLGIFGLSVAFILLLKDFNLPTTTILNDILVFSPLTRALSMVVCLIGVVSYLLVYAEAKKEGFLPEIYALLLLSILGMFIVVHTSHLLLTFIGIEIMSLAVYVLVGIKRTTAYSAEAAMKYFILGGVASAILLYGIALLFGATGTFSLNAIAKLMEGQVVQPTLGLVAGMLLMGGMLFKVGAFPFHFWVPDVYQGASHSVTGFMSAAVKFAAFVPFIKLANMFFFAGPQNFSNAFYVTIWVFGALTMIVANLAALGQYELKRLLAYSSIAHTGYLLTGILVAGNRSILSAPIFIYLAFYVLSNLGAMAVVVLLARHGKKDLAFEDLVGLSNRHPWLATGLSVFLLAMAGIPLTAGFIGKYILFNNVVGQGEVLLVVIAVLSSVVSVYYYLRVIVFMFMKDSEAHGRVDTTEGNLALIDGPNLNVGTFGALFVVGAMAVLTLQMGIFPRVVVDLFKHLLE